MQIISKKAEFVEGKEEEEIEQTARQAARTQLESIPVPANSMPGLVQQVKLLKRMMGLKESE